MSIPEEFQGSPTFQFITSQGWDWKKGQEPNIELDTCPYCKKSGYGHFYIEIHGAADPLKTRDGLHMCHKCGKSGRLYDLKSHLGVIIPGVESRKDWSGAEKKVEDLPDVGVCHAALLEDVDAMDYLVNGRGFSPEIIAKQKIGLVPKRYFKECGNVKALVYPYLVNSNCVFVHYRTLPTMPLSENKVVKAFSSPAGWEVPLYNGEILRPGLKEVILVEGEPNTIVAMDKGITNICGVPGASLKKAEWIEKLDTIGLEKIYICYDKDKVGQKAAQVLAARVGVERCWKIRLPDFMVTTEEGETRPGKDLNEWFTTGGGTAEAFEKLKEEAQLFDVDGVTSTTDAIGEFMEELLGHGIEPKYKTQWPSLNKLVGFDTGDCIDILSGEKQGKSTIALNMLEHMVDTYGEDGCFVCLEMSRARLARKWIAHKAQIADNVPKTPEEAKLLTAQFMKAIPEVQQMAADREGELYFCYPRYKTAEDVYTLIRDCIRRYGIKWVVIDNIQRLCDTTIGDRGRTQYLSEISKVTSQIAKDYGIQMIRILQPHRIGQGKMVSTDNVDGSSQIAKDCDCMITIHRSRVGQLTQEQFDSIGAHVEQEQAFDDKALITVGLSRYSSGGYTTLHYDGARSTFSEFNQVQAALMEAKLPPIGHTAQMKSMNITPKEAPKGTEVGQLVDEAEITI